MEQLFNDLQKQIATTMGNTVSLIDEDYGQLEALMNGDDQYPVTFPCVLIAQPEVEWNCLSGKVQQGKCLMVVKLAFDCYDDTHYGSGQENKVAERKRAASTLNANIHLWRFDGCMIPMKRIRSREYTLPGGIKIYEQTYETMLLDTIQTD